MLTRHSHRNSERKEELYGSYAPCIFSFGSWLSYVPNCDVLPCFKSLPLSSQTLFRIFHFHPFILQEFVMNSQNDQEHCIGAARIMGSIPVRVWIFSGFLLVNVDQFRMVFYVLNLLGLTNLDQEIKKCCKCQPQTGLIGLIEMYA